MKSEMVQQAEAEMTNVQAMRARLSAARQKVLKDQEQARARLVELNTRRMTLLGKLALGDEDLMGDLDRVEADIQGQELILSRVEPTLTALEAFAETENPAALERAKTIRSIYSQYKRLKGLLEKRYAREDERSLIVRAKQIDMLADAEAFLMKLENRPDHLEILK